MRLSDTALALAILSSGALAKAPDGVAPIWLCSAERMTICHDGDCVGKAANVLAEVDFEAMTIRNLNLGSSLPLVSVSKSEYGNTVYFHSGDSQMWVMDAPKEAPGGATVREWQTVMATSGRHLLTYYGECRLR